MFARLCNPLLSNSFFVFGARGTGKSTLVNQVLGKQKKLTIDLLLPVDEERYSRDPQQLQYDVVAQAGKIEWVFVDEIQRLPKLLDVVHALMESGTTRHIHFALTGSSARKLKIIGANLLAGRAFMNDLYPLCASELGSSFNLDAALNWGTLPKIFALQDELSKQEYLRTYTRSYLKEEVWDQRLVHSLDPFRKFIEIAAQTNGATVNFSNIARDSGVDDKTAKKFFEILADTFLGFYLESYHRSVRKQQLQSPKFYIFDPGVCRAMAGLLTVPLAPGTYDYGKSFEHFVICECRRLNAYHRLDFKFFYLRTKDDLEIDLIIERPGRSPVIVEIKSSKSVDDRDFSVLRKFVRDFPKADFCVWSQDTRPQAYQGMRAVHWRHGLVEAGLETAETEKEREM